MYRFIPFTLLILIVLNLVGCSSTTDKLGTAERLMETAPDSALSILKEINPDYLTGRSDEALYALLMTLALDKKDIRLESDSLIRIAAEYYNQNDPVRAGYAWYYMARYAGNQGKSKEQAAAIFSAMEFAKKTRDYYLQGLLYVEKSNLYASQYQTDSALVYRKLSYRAFKKINNTYNCVINLFNIGQVYQHAQQADSAIIYYLLAKKLSKTLNDTVINSSVFRSLAAGYIQKGDNKRALYYINQTPLTHIPIYDSNTTYLKARIFIETGKFDSARYYLNRVKEPQEMAPDYYHLWQTVYEHEGNYQKALYYANKLTETKDSIYKRKLDISFAGLEKKYKFEKLQVSNQRLTIKNNEKKILLLMGIVMISLTLLIMLSRSNRAKRQELKDQIKLVEKEKENSQLLEQQIKMRNILLLNVEQYRRYAIKRPALASEKQPVISPIQNLTFHEELIACMDIEYHDISKRLADRFPDLTGHDILICCLILAGFESGMMATVLDIKIESISKQRYRLRSKLNMQNSDNMVEYLRNF